MLLCYGYAWAYFCFIYALLIQKVVRTIGKVKKRGFKFTVGRSAEPYVSFDTICSNFSLNVAWLFAYVIIPLFDQATFDILWYKWINGFEVRTQRRVVGEVT